MWLLLCARKTGKVPGSPVRQLLTALNNVLLARPFTIGYTKQACVHHTHHCFVLGGIQHQPCGSSLHLHGEVFHGFGHSFAKPVCLDSMILQHFSNDFDRGLADVACIALSSINLQNAHLLQLASGPPFKLHSPARVAINDLKRGLPELRCLSFAILTGRSFQSVDELSASLLDSCVGATLSQALVISLPVLVILTGLLVGHLLRRGAQVRLNPRVLTQLSSSKSFVFLFLQQCHGQLLDLLGGAHRKLQLLLEDLFLALEGKTAINKAIHHNPDGPSVNLEGVVLLKELGWPIELCATCFLQPVFRLDLDGSAKVTEVNLTLRVDNVLYTNQEVVTLHVAVHHGLAMQV
mmetsp:Transcript_54588/g.130232  ORF Transcript_54588/g.130232 Transcript_54588/m.130232 type:complete len:350 (-) Transcript_54588:497-1546(-)